MSRRVSFATVAPNPPPQRRLPVADDAWGNEYLVVAPAATAEPPRPAAAAAIAVPLPLPLPRTRHHHHRFPTLRALCLTTLAQHLFLLSDVATTTENPDILRHSIPCADDRLALAAAARRRSELSSTPLFLALADPCWPVLCVGGEQPPVQAVIEAAKAGLLRGLRKVEWVLPSETGGVVATTTTPSTTTILLPSEAASLVRNLAAYCDSLEELHLKRSDPARQTRTAVAAAVAKALLAAALPKGLVVVGKRRSDEDEEEQEPKRQQPAAPESWEDALQAEDQQTKPTTTTFPPSFRSLRWQDLPDAAADAIASRCPRIALDRRKNVVAKAPEIDTSWLSMLSPGWDDRAALIQEQKEEERAKREAARGKGLALALAAVAVSEESESEEEEDAQPRQQLEDSDDEDTTSIAAKFKRAYIERAQRLKQVEKAKEAQRRRKAVRASPSLGLVERWLDEPV